MKVKSAECQVAVHLSLQQAVEHIVPTASPHGWWASLQFTLRIQKDPGSR